jgi:O-antigen/teichoic acid export membrane protein
VNSSLLFKKVFSDSVVYGLSNTLSKFFTILLVPLYTRLLTQAEFGAFDLLLAMIYIGALILSLQIESATARFFYEAQEQGKQEELISTTFWALLVVPFVGVIICFIVQDDLSFFLFKDTSQSIWVVWAAMVVPFYIQFHYKLLILRLLGHKWTYLAVSTGTIFFTFVLVIFLLNWLGLGVKGIFISQIAGYGSGVIMCFFILKKYIRLCFSSHIFKEVLVYGLPIVPAVVSGWLLNYANRFILISFTDLTEVGIYSLAVKVASIILLFQQAFRMAWVPYSFSVMKEEGSREFYARMFSFHCFIMGIMIIITTLFADEIVSVFAPIDYSEAARYVGVISLGIAISGNLFFALGNSIVKKTYCNTAGFIAGAGINLVGLYLTVEKFPLAACALWFTCGSLMANILILMISQKNYPIPYATARYALWFIFLGALSLARLLQPVNRDLTFVLFLLKIATVLVLIFCLSLIILKPYERKNLISILTSFKTIKKELTKSIV